MSLPVLAFFNNKGGVGKTSMVYHVSWMLAHLGMRNIAADLDPQANLTSAFLDDDRIEEVFGNDGHALTVRGSVDPLIRGTGDIAEPHIERVDENIGVVLGDMALSRFEDQLSEVWPKCLSGDERALRVTSAFWRILQAAGRAADARLILVDLGPNLGAINRAALIAADYVAIPLGPDLFSLHGLRNLGPALREWRLEWRARLERSAAADLQLPAGRIAPVGYLILRHSIRLDRPVKAFERWVARIPDTYRHDVLDEAAPSGLAVADDAHCIAALRDYRSLMPLSREANKPMFMLKPADGALGAHANAVQDCFRDFEKVARELLHRIGITL